jgi:hypothetical protein
MTLFISKSFQNIAIEVLVNRLPRCKVLVLHDVFAVGKVQSTFCLLWSVMCLPSSFGETKSLSTGGSVF